MISKDAQHLAAVIRTQFGLHELIPHLTRLLAAGEPVTIKQAAETGGWTIEQIRAELARYPGVDWADDGRIAGFGATLRPTPHRFTTDDGRAIYGFCASDALTYPAILGRPGVIESICPVTGQAIRVEVTPDQVITVNPPQAVVSRVRPDTAVADVRAEICSLGNFFSTPHAAADWQAHNPDGELVPIADDFETNRQSHDRTRMDHHPRVGMMTAAGAAHPRDTRPGSACSRGTGTGAPIPASRTCAS